MITSVVRSLWIASDSNSSMISLTTAHLVPGRGIEGDRYYYGRGTFPTGERSGYEVTLIEEDMLHDLVQDGLRTGIMKGTRRNIIVSGCSLATLVERPFRIGEVMLRGLMPHYLHCSPHEIREEQRLRRGIGAQILTEGFIHVGDEICNVSLVRVG
ncbi:MAG: hypothetical protein JOZ18_22860 [Chloroflexi bacterium]|nr:hypothetical protein [Chloroflexota bacterium]